MFDISFLRPVLNGRQDVFLRAFSEIQCVELKVIDQDLILASAHSEIVISECEEILNVWRDDPSVVCHFLPELFSSDAASTISSPCDDRDGYIAAGKQAAVAQAQAVDIVEPPTIERTFNISYLAREIGEHKGYFANRIADMHGISVKWSSGGSGGKGGTEARVGGGGWALHASSQHAGLMDLFGDKLESLRTNKLLLNELLPISHSSSGRIEITSIAHILISNNKRVLRYLQRQFNVSTSTIFSRGGLGGDGSVFMEIEAPSSDLRSIFVSKIQSIIQHPAGFQEELDEIAKRRVHIYVDTSNITIGALCSQGREAIEFSTAKHVKVSNLIEVVTGLRTVARKVKGF